MNISEVNFIFLIYNFRDLLREVDQSYLKMTQLASARENFLRVCLCITGVIAEMLKYLIEIHLSPGSIHERVEKCVKARKLKPLPRLPCNIKRFVIQAKHKGYKDMDLAIVFWVMHNLLGPSATENFMEKTEDLKRILNLLYSKRFKQYLSEEEFENVDKEILNSCKTIQQGFHLQEDYVRKLTKSASQHIDPTMQCNIVEDFVISCRSDEGGELLSDESIIGNVIHTWIWDNFDKLIQSNMVYFDILCIWLQSYIV